MQTRSARLSPQPQLLQLSGDALGAVLCILSPRAVGRLQCTCSALAGAASENEEWQLMRLMVQRRGWKRAFRVAICFGKLQQLEWGRAQGCQMDETTCGTAAFNGNLDVLKWARNQTPPCPWDADTCTGAALNGHLDVLKWARSQSPPCPWDAITCTFAAKKGHVEVLRWLRAQVPPCPWRARLCLKGAEEAESAPPELLHWLRAEVEGEQGGPVG